MRKKRKEDVAPEAPAKKVSPLKGRKLGPSPLKGRKLGPRKPKEEGITRAQLATELKPGLNALFGLEFKSVLYRELGSRNKRLAVDQSEALDMIMTKIARVINGDADHVDTWNDIAGYAKLVAERLQGRTL